MINEKNKFLTVSWLSGLLSAEIFISTGEWGVQMPPHTSENRHFLRSGPQEATLVMWLQLHWWQTQIEISDAESFFLTCNKLNLSEAIFFVGSLAWHGN